MVPVDHGQLWGLLPAMLLVLVVSTAALRLRDGVGADCGRRWFASGGLPPAAALVFLMAGSGDECHDGGRDLRYGSAGKQLASTLPRSSWAACFLRGCLIGC